MSGTSLVEATHSWNDTSKRSCTGAGQLPVTIQCKTDGGTGSNAVKARTSAWPHHHRRLTSERGVRVRGASWREGGGGWRKQPTRGIRPPRRRSLRLVGDVLERIPLRGAQLAAGCAVVAQSAELLLDLVHDVVRVDRGEPLVENGHDLVPTGIVADPAPPAVRDSAQDPLERLGHTVPRRTGHVGR